MSLENAQELIKDREDLADFVAIGVMSHAAKLCAAQGIINLQTYRRSVSELTDSGLGARLIEAGALRPIHLVALCQAMVWRDLVRGERISQDVLDQSLERAALLVAESRRPKAITRVIGLSEEDRVAAVTAGLTSVSKMIYIKGIKD